MFDYTFFSTLYFGGLPQILRLFSFKFFFVRTRRVNLEKFPPLVKLNAPNLIKKEIFSYPHVLWKYVVLGCIPCDR